MVRRIPSIIGKEVREQMDAAEGRLPDTLICGDWAAGRTDGPVLSVP